MRSPISNESEAEERLKVLHGGGYLGFKYSEPAVSASQSFRVMGDRLNISHNLSLQPRLDDT